jgi:hypothetical protein
MKRFMAMTCAALFGLTLAAATAGATTSGTPGQPNQNCQVSLGYTGPGGECAGIGVQPKRDSRTVYAGTQTQNSQNPKSVSQ